MFTGIVEELGTVVAVEEAGDTTRLTIEGPVVTTDATHGASIAVDGVCLTVTDDARAAGRFTVDMMGETLARTALGDLEPGDRVNLERAMATDDRFSGHIVQGHVDGVGTLLQRDAGERWDTVTFSLPTDLARYVVEKGSITVSGVSLTVTAVSEPGASEPWFSVGLIPTTLDLTTLGAAQPGTRVNLEVDVIGKYLERLLAFRAVAG